MATGVYDSTLGAIGGLDHDVNYSRGSNGEVVLAESVDSLPMGFAAYWNTKKHWDLTIDCRDQTFKVHKVLLSGLSPYFAAAIDSKSEEGIPCPTLSVDCEPELMGLCLEYLYTGRVLVNQCDAGAVARLAKQLNIPHLYARCKSTTLQDAVIDVTTCLDMLCFAAEIGNQEMLAKCKPFALANFEELFEHESFVNLCNHCLIDLLRDDKLAVSSAAERLSAALLWVEHDSIARTEHLPSLLQSLPLREIPKLTLRQTLQNTLVASQPKACEIITDTLDRIKRDGLPVAVSEEVRPTAELVFEDALLPSTPPSSAAQPKIDRCLVTMGSQFPDTLLRNKKVLVTPLSFTSQWYQLTTLPSWLPKDGGVACCIYGSKLYTTGLGKNNKETWCFDLEMRKWKRYGNLNHQRSSHCMAVCDDRIYVLGGHYPGSSVTLVNTIEVLHSPSQTWQLVGRLQGSECINACCCVLRDSIIVHGVLDYDSDKWLIQRFWPHTQQSECVVSFIPGVKTSVCGIVAVNDHIILADDSQKIYICPSPTSCVKLQVRKRDRYSLPLKCSALCLSDDGQHLIAVGGVDGDVPKGSFIFRAAVNDVIHNRGSGWQSMNMNWPKQELICYPGSLCQGEIAIDGLDVK